MPGLCGHGAPPLHADQAEPGPGARPRRGSPPDRGPARNPCLGDRGGRARGPPRAPRRRRRRGGGLVPPLCRRPHRGEPARVPRCLEPSRRAGPKPLFMLMSPNPLFIAGVEFSSRLFVGTGKFSSGEIMRRSLEASGTQLVTVALGRVRTGGEPDDILGHLDPGRFRLLPNTSGTRNAREAVLAAELAREALETNWLKLEIHPDPKYLMPDATETLQATELLAKRGFVVLPYVHADPVLCKRLAHAGVSPPPPTPPPRPRPVQAARGRGRRGRDAARRPDREQPGPGVQGVPRDHHRAERRAGRRRRGAGRPVPRRGRARDGGGRSAREHGDRRGGRPRGDGGGVPARPGALPCRAQWPTA